MDIIISSATHRSGSTLLQRIFNKRKKTLIWGEQDGLITHFHQIHKNLAHYSVDLKNQRNNYFNNDEDTDTWIACMTPEMKYVDKAVKNSLKVMLDSLYEQHRETHDMIGFKEVRYGENELQLFRECYPNAKIVLLVRNPIDIWGSMLGSGLAGNVQPLINKWNDRASYYLQMVKDDPNTYLIQYENLVKEELVTIQILSKLGKLPTKDIHAVISKKIWSSQRPIPEQVKKLIRNQCGQLMKQYGYL